MDDRAVVVPPRVRLHVRLSPFGVSEDDVKGGGDLLKQIGVEFFVQRRKLLTVFEPVTYDRRATNDRPAETHKKNRLSRMVVVR